MPEEENLEVTLKNRHERGQILSYHLVDLKWQNHLKVRTNKPKLKVTYWADCSNYGQQQQGGLIGDSGQPCIT